MSDYRIFLENTGDADTFDISLSYDNPDGNWTVYSGIWELELEAGETGEFYLHVSPHDNSTRPEDGTELQVKIIATARTGTTKDNIQALARCVYQVEYGLALSESTQFRTAEPSYGGSDTVVFEFQLVNTGTVTDSFRCEVDENLTRNGLLNWVTITQGGYVSKLAPGDSTNITVEVEVRPFHQDPDAGFGLKDIWLNHFSVGARDNSEEQENKTTALFRVRVDIQEYYHVTIDNLNTNVPKLQTGENATFEIKVENLGNEVDTISLVNTGDSPTNGDYSTWQTFDRSAVTLAPDSSTTVNMTITVDPGDDAPTDTYNFYYYGKSQSDTSVVSATRSNTIDIEETYGVLVEVNNDLLTVKPGDAASFAVLITNKGNSRTDIALITPTVAEGWDAYWATSQGSTTEVDKASGVDPDDTETLYLKVTPSENTSKAMADDYKIAFKVSSGQGADTTSAYGNVTVSIEAEYGLNVKATSDKVDIEPGEIKNYTLKLENRGNNWDNFTFEIIDSQQFDWIVMDIDNVGKVDVGAGRLTGYNEVTKEFTLKPWEFVRVPFIVSVPDYDDDNDDAEADYEYLIDVEFTSRGDSAKNQKLLLTTTIEQVYDLDITSPKDTETAKIKQNGYAFVEFTIEVQNLGNGDDSFIAKVPAGEFENEKEDWTVEFRYQGTPIPQSEFDLDSLAKKAITVNVGVDDRTHTGLHDLNIQLSSKGDFKIKKTFPLHLDCEQALYGVEISSVNEDNRIHQTANPADMPRDGIEYRFKLKNTGQEADSYFLGVETNTGSGVYSGWKLLFASALGSRDTMTIPEDAPGWTGAEFLDPGEELEFRVFVKPPENEDVSGDDLDKYAGLEISALSQQNEVINESISFRLIVVRPDLRIGSEDIYFNTSRNLKKGEHFKLEVTIHNDGETESGKFDVWVYQSLQDSLSGFGGVVGNGGLIAHEKDVDSIDPSSVYTLEIDWVLEWGEHDIYVSVDKPIWSGVDKTDDTDNGNVIEESERNNDAEMGLDPLSNRPYNEFLDFRPWVEVAEIDWDHHPREDEYITLTVTIYNNDSHTVVASYGEDANDGDMYVRCKAGGDFLKPVKSGTADQGYRVNEVLEPGDTLEIEFEWKVNEDADTVVNLKAYIDYDENRNDNTSRSVSVEIDDPEEIGEPHFLSPSGLLYIASCFLLPLLVIMGAMLYGQNWKLHDMEEKLRWWETHGRVKKGDLCKKKGDSVPLKPGGVPAPLREKTVKNDVKKSGNEDGDVQKEAENKELGKSPEEPGKEKEEEKEEKKEGLEVSVELPSEKKEESTKGSGKSKRTAT